MNLVNLRRVDQTGSVLRKPVDGLLSWRSGKAPHGAGRPVLSTDDAKTCHGHCASTLFREPSQRRRRSAVDIRPGVRDRLPSSLLLKESKPRTLSWRIEAKHA